VRKPIIIRTPYPTVEETARRLGLSARAVEELRQMSREFAEKTFGNRRRVASKAASKKAAAKRGNARKRTGK
jgi:hypothetical protein